MMLEGILVKFYGVEKQPMYQTAESAGCDLAASHDSFVPPNGGVAAVGTGLYLEIPTGFEGQVRSRSGMALKHKVVVLNSPGTIDSDYRGEVKVILINYGTEPFIIKKGDRIAQLIFSQVYRASFWRSEEPLGETGRASGGFGSTGKLN